MATVTVPIESGCDSILASNFDPDLAVGYQENGDAMPRTFTRANSGKLVTQIIEGRRAPLAFRALVEGDSDVFDRTFVVAMDTAGNPLTSVDRAPFDPIVALIEAALPCVVLVDGHGRRWFTAPDFTSGSYTYSGHEHQAIVHFTEIDGGPFPVITSAPWT